MSEYTFTYGGVTFKVSWGMMFQRAFWDAGVRLGDAFDAVEMLVICIFQGNRAYHNLNGGVPAFKSKQEVYKLIETHCQTEQGPIDEGEIIAAFVETQAYKSLLPKLEESDGEKKT